MKALLVLLGVLCSGVCQTAKDTYYSGMMTFTDKDSFAQQRIPHITNSVVIMTLNQVSYNTLFALTVRDGIVESGDTDIFSLNVTIRSATQSLLIHKITIQYIVMMELPFLQAVRINFTSTQTSKQVTSAKHIQYDQNVALAAFPISFSNVNFTTEIYFYATRSSTNYTIYSKSNFTDKDWVLLDLIILNESPSDTYTCQDSYITTISKVNNKSTPFYFQKRANHKYIFGTEALYLSTGDISFNSAELTVDISGKGLFDFSAVVLNVDCQPRQLTTASPNNVIVVHDTVFIVLTLVFGSLLLLLILTVAIFLWCCSKRIQWSPKEQMSSSLGKSDKASDKMPSNIEKQIELERGVNADVAGQEDPQSDTRITQKSSPRRQYRRASRIQQSSPATICRYPTCSNNHDAMLTPATLHLKRPCQGCLGRTSVNSNIV